MVSPIDYTIDVASPFQTAMQGWAMGTQDKLARADEARRQQIFDQQQEAQKQQQIQQQIRNEALYNFSQIPNKTADDYASIITRFPELSEPYQKSWSMLNSDRQQQTLSTASQVFESLRNGAPNVAKDILEEQIKAYENTGMKREASNLKSIYGLIDKNPAVAQANLGMLMASVAPDQFKSITEGRIGLETLPSQIAKTQAETGKIIAETNDIPLAAEDRRTGVENQGKKIEYDNQNFYDKLSQDQQQFYDSLDKTERIEVARLRAAKAESPIQRVERLEKVENYANAAKQAADASNLAAKLTLQAKENSGAYWDRLVRQVPGTSENTFAKDIETLKSQVFLAQVEKMRGLGALTDKEGDAIRSSIASLDINQGPKAVQKNLSKIAQQMSAAAKSANRKAQLYATKGDGYSPAVMSAAKTLGISPAEAQKFVNENGL